jgi:hypothetical protein
MSLPAVSNNLYRNVAGEYNNPTSESVDGESVGDSGGGTPGGRDKAKSSS